MRHRDLDEGEVSGWDERRQVKVKVKAKAKEKPTEKVKEGSLLRRGGIVRHHNPELRREYYLPHLLNKQP